MRTYTELDGFLAAIDGLGLRPGSWIATDADGTLWTCDVADEGWRRLIRERRLRPACAPALERILVAGGKRPTGDLHRDAEQVHRVFLDPNTPDNAIIYGMTQCYAGWSPAELEAFAAELATSLAPRAYATTAALLRGLEARGLRRLVVSGSPTVLVRATVAALGVEPPPVLGTNLRVEDGIYTDDMVEPVTWNAGKIAATKTLIGEEPIAVSFGDSGGDTELLQSTQALKVLVHPRPGLRQTGLNGEGQWCVFAPKTMVNGDPVVPPASDHIV